MTQQTISGKIIRSGSIPLAALAAGLAVVSVNHAASPFAVASAVASVIVCDTSGGAITVDLPAATGSGNILFVLNSTSATATTITPHLADTINGLASAMASSMFGLVELIDVAAGTWIIGSQEPVPGAGMSVLDGIVTDIGEVVVDSLTGAVLYA